MTFSNFTDAYLYSLEQIFLKGKKINGVMDSNSIGSLFGNKSRPFREIIDYGFTLESSNTILLNPTPSFIDYNFSSANFLWFLSGSNKVEDISIYSSKGTSFSDDGIEFSCALGSRCFPSNAINQLDGVIKCLRKDPTSRRALIVFYLDSDTTNCPKDTPCAISLQFFIRDSKLICYCVMRSQSAAMILPHDIFLFTSIQELIACALGIESGPYYFRAGSFHFYEDEIESIFSYIQNAPLPKNNYIMPSAMAEDYNLMNTALLQEKINRSLIAASARPSNVSISSFWNFHIYNAAQRLINRLV